MTIRFSFMEILLISKSLVAFFFGNSKVWVASKPFSLNQLANALGSWASIDLRPFK